MINNSLFHFLKRLALICLLCGMSGISNAYNFSSGVFEFQQKLAKKGDPQAQYKLGYIYENGQGVKVDLDEATKWYKKSAAQNNDAATMRLTYIDIKKTGYKKSKHQSWLKKLQKDAAAKDGESLFLLAGMHKKGFIVEKDLNKSASLFKSAGIRNVPGAEAELESVNTLIYNEKYAKQQKADADKIKREQAQKEQAKKDRAAKSRENKARENKAREDRARESRANKEKRLAQERKKSTEQHKKQQATAQQRKKELARQEAEKKRLAADDQEEKIESEPINNKDVCKGKKARFLTMCR